MNADIRLKVSFLNHRKRKKLQRALGAAGVLAFIDLMLSAATSRPDGIFTGYDKEDVAIDAQWEGDVDKFVDTLVAVGLLDVLEHGVLAIHDWQDHNGYASDAEIRSGEGRFGNLKKYYPHRAKELEAKGITTISASEYATIKAEEAGASRVVVGGESGASRGEVAPGRYPSPPSPSPSPSPNPTHAQDAGARVDSPPASGKTPEPEQETPPLRTDPPRPPGQAIPEYSFEFEELWDQYPRKEGKGAAWQSFKNAKAARQYPGNPIVLPMVVAWRASPAWQDEGGRFVPMLSKWLRERRWDDGPPEDEAAKLAKQLADLQALEDAKQAARGPKQ